MSVMERQQSYTHISIKSLLIAIRQLGEYGFLGTGFVLSVGRNNLTNVSVCVGDVQTNFEDLPPVESLHYRISYS
jgi:hypothetical protein